MTKTEEKEHDTPTKSPCTNCTTIKEVERLSLILEKLAAEMPELKEQGS